MLREPVISILLPAYNASRWLDACLSSLLAQSFSSFEIIVVDDGSTDGTADAVLSFAMADARVHLHRMPVNQGIVRALNYGLALCKGDFVARMDADDVAIRDRLLKQHSFLMQRPDVDLIGSQVESIDEEGRVLGLSRQPLSHRATVLALSLTSSGTAFSVDGPEVGVRAPLRLS